MGPVILVVHRIPVAVGEIVAVDVIDVAVAVIILAPLAAQFGGVDPHVGGQVGMIVIHARIDHGDDRVAAAGGGLPGLGRIDVGVGGASGLSRIVQSPEGIKLAVIRHEGRVEAIVGLGVKDPGIRLVGGQSGIDADVVCQFHLAQSGHDGKGPADFRAVQNRRAVEGPGCQRPASGFRAEADQD